MNRFRFACVLALAAASASANGLRALADTASPSQNVAARLEALERQVRALGKEKPAPLPHVAESGAHKFSLVSADGDTTFAVTGRLHLDLGDYAHFQPRSLAVGPQSLSSGFNARRARIGVTGKLLGDWSYQFIYDGGNSQDSTAGGIEWAQISYIGWKGIIIDLPGYSEPAFTLDTATSSNDIMFLERATPVNLATSLNTGDFRANAGIRVYGDWYWLGAYLTGPANGDSHTNAVERLGSFQRASVQLFTGTDYSVHLGAGIAELLQAANNGAGTAQTITLSDRPELRLDPTAFLSTGALGSAAHPVRGGLVGGLEAAMQYQGFYAQSEYFHYQVRRRALPDANFAGAYGQIAWTLTGEHRNYAPASGAYSAITPDHPFSFAQDQWGAWEIAARYSYADLTDQFDAASTLASQANAVNGGIETGLTIGVNWYLNPSLRIMLNYVRTNYAKANGALVTGAALGVPVGAKIDALALRTQLSW